MIYKRRFRKKTLLVGSGTTPTHNRNRTSWRVSFSTASIARHRKYFFFWCQKTGFYLLTWHLLKKPKLYMIDTLLFGSTLPTAIACSWGWKAKADTCLSYISCPTRFFFSPVSVFHASTSPQSLPPKTQLPQGLMRLQAGIRKFWISEYDCITLPVLKSSIFRGEEGCNVWTRSLLPPGWAETRQTEPPSNPST